MGTFVITLDVTHWIFFFTYFECSVTMPYYLFKEKCPPKLAIAILIFNIIMIFMQILAPVMTFIYAQLINNYYFNGNFDYSGV